MPDDTGAGADREAPEHVAEPPPTADAQAVDKGRKDRRPAPPDERDLLSQIADAVSHCFDDIPDR